MTAGRAARETAPAATRAVTTCQRLGECDERAGAREQRQHERDRAIAADARIAHDAQLVLARAPAAEAVGDVGQAVLVQRAGQRRWWSPARAAAAGQGGRPSQLASA